MSSSRSLKHLWRKKSDAELLAAAKSIPEFTEDAEAVIRAEIRRRHLPEPTPAEISSKPPHPKPPTLHVPLTAKLCYMLAGLSAIALYSSIKTLHLENELRFVLVMSFVGFGVLGAWLTSLHRKSVQKRRDKAARLLADRILAGEDMNPFFLYLRPFVLTGKIVQPNPRKSYVPLVPGFFEPRRLDLEIILSDAMATIAPIVALGRPGEHFGSGRLSAAENDWREVVKRLTEKAATIVVVPSYHPGTLWEVDLIKQSASLRKCLFVMPAQAGFIGLNISDYWSKTSAALADIGLGLPLYDKGGCWFKLDDWGNVCLRKPLKLASEADVKADVSEMLASVECHHVIFL